jgi:hypothetical protein
VRCKQCGKELPLFKKLADNDFCSAEHRELFVEAQHQLMLGRLQESGRRMRSRLSAPARDPLVPPPPDPNPPPRPLFGFVEEFPRLSDPAFEVWLIAAALEISPLVWFPDLVARAGMGLAHRIAIPGIQERSGIRGIWGRPHPLAFEPFVRPPHRESSSGQVGIGALGRLFALTQCDARDWRAAFSQMIANGPGWPRESRRIPSASATLLAGFGATSPLLPFDQPSSATAAFRFQAVEAASAAGELTPLIPRLGAGFSGSVMPSSPGRPYRMRPRTPVGWAGLPQFVSIPPAGAASAALAATTPRLSANQSVSGLQVLQRVYRMRPGGPVRGRDVAPWLFLPAAPEAGFGFATVPAWFPAQPIRQPRVAERLFRSRPRTGVAGGANLAAIGADAGCFSPIAAVPVPEASGSEPKLVQRFFKARPRAGISDARLLSFEVVQPRQAQGNATQGLIPAAAFGVTAITAEPPLLTRVFRMRPRACIADGRLAVLHAVDFGPADSSTLPFLPVTPGEVQPCQPAALDKTYRMRPRAGIADDRLALWHLVGAAAVDSSPRPFFPAVAKELQHCQPAALDKTYRMRPRAGIPDDRLAPWHALDSGAVDSSARPYLPVVEAKPQPCQPAATDKPYRTRARAGIACATIAAHLPVDASASPVILHPVVSAPLFGGRDCAPPLLERTYRMRPRTGIEDRSAVNWLHNSATAVLPFAPSVLVPQDLSRTFHIPDEKVPPFVEKLYRMRPRSGINDRNAAAQEPGLDGSVAYSQGTPQVLPQAVLAATESLSSPDRLFRMRPRGGVRGQFATVLNRPDSLPPDHTGCSYPGMTGGVPALASAESPFGLPAASARRSGAALWKTEPSILAKPVTAERPSIDPAECAPLAAVELFPSERPNQVLSALAPEVQILNVGPVEDSEIFVMPPVPELHVVHEYDMPRSDRQTRIGPPTASAGTPDLRGEGAEPLDGAMVARVMLASSMVDGFETFRKAMAVIPAFRRDPAWKRVWGSMQSAWLGRDFRGLTGWLHAPVIRLATCGAGVLCTVMLWSASYAPVSSATGRSSMPLAKPTPAITAFSKNVKQSIADRSATDLRDDFATGLHDWAGDGDWSASWNYDERGGIIPGALAILKPSRPLTDYTVEFLGQIEKQALGFTVRSADTQNYQAVKLAIKTPGPLPVISIVHYAVVAGAESARLERRLPVTVFNDTIYRVRLAVRDDTFTLAVNDQVVDAWVDNRIATGGVGLFAGKGERSRIYDLRVYHQADALGKALALIADKEPQGEKRISQQ